MKLLISCVFALFGAVSLCSAEFFTAAQAYDSTGLAHSLVVERDGDVYSLFYGLSDEGSLTKYSHIVSERGQITSPAPVITAGGKIFAAWVFGCCGFDAVFVSEKKQGSWTHPQKISANKPYPALMPEFYHDGELLILFWVGYDGDRYIERSARLENGRWKAEGSIPAGELSAPPDQAVYDDKFLGFGDSVTAGVRREPWDGDGYKSRLQGLLRSEMNENAFVVLRGVPGEFTSGGLNRIDSVLSADRPGHILIMEGINDLQARLSYGSILFNIKEMVRKSKNYGAEPVVGILPPRDDSHAWQSYTKEFNDDYLRPYLEQDDILRADHWEIFMSTPDWRTYLDSGDQHPNAAGYDLLGESWFLALLPPAPPEGLHGWVDGGAVLLAWEDDTSYWHAGYNVYRSEAPGAGYYIINEELLMSPSFVDEAPAGEYIYYAVSSLSKSGRESEPCGPIIIDLSSSFPCFVATAAFGTPMAEEVRILSRARDSYLLKHSSLRALVKAYYILSPAPSALVAGNGFLAALARMHIKPFVLEEITDDTRQVLVVINKQDRNVFTHNFPLFLHIPENRSRSSETPLHPANP